MRRADQRAVVRHFLLALAPIFCMVPLQGATLERLSLDDMITQSTAIVRGTVKGSYGAFSGPAIYTHYSIQVLETLKGSAQGSLEVLVPGGVANNLRQTVAGAPELHTGDQYVFFLWTSKAGLTQIIGLTQGLFTLPSGPVTSDATVSRAPTREVMLDPVSGRPVKDQVLVMRLRELRADIARTLAAAKKGATQ
ncbi:MAG TPA: hypothetical protein VG675_25035 [Bryobacteraceae bacterium]|nr:hypothetical protein [Bryobacteraceae bacterium]